MTIFTDEFHEIKHIVNLDSTILAMCPSKARKCTFPLIERKQFTCLLGLENSDTRKVVKNDFTPS